jgi:hypothetical protein
MLQGSHWLREGLSQFWDKQLSQLVGEKGEVHVAHEESHVEVSLVHVFVKIEFS